MDIPVFGTGNKSRQRYESQIWTKRNWFIMRRSYTLKNLCLNNRAKRKIHSKWNCLPFGVDTHWPRVKFRRRRTEILLFNVRQQSMGFSIKWLILTSVFICLKTPFNVVQDSLRLRVVSFFRERAWKSPHARTGITRRVIFTRASLALLSLRNNGDYS